MINIYFFKQFTELPVLPTEQWVSIMQFMPGCYDDYSQNSLFGLFDNATQLEIVEHFEHGQID